MGVGEELSEEAGTAAHEGLRVGRRGAQAHDTHESVTDPDARMYRKGRKTGWKLQHMAHVVSENEHGLVVATAVSACSPGAERQAAIAMVRG